MNGNRKVTSGEPLAISANTWNKVIDLVESGSRPGAGYYTYDANYPSVIKVLVKNPYTGGSEALTYDYDRFDVVSLTAAGVEPFIKEDAELDEFKQRPQFILRYVADSWDKVGILLEPIARGEVGYAAIAGIVPVQIDIKNTYHKNARVIPYYGGTYKPYLESNTNGPFQILYKPSGTGVKWCYVFLPTMSHYIEFAGQVASSYDIVRGARRLAFNQTDFRVSVPLNDATDAGSFIVSQNRTTTTTSSWMGY